MSSSVLLTSVNVGTLWLPAAWSVISVSPIAQITYLHSLFLFPYRLPSCTSDSCYWATLFTDHCRVWKATPSLADTRRVDGLYDFIFLALVLPWSSLIVCCPYIDCLVSRPAQFCFLIVFSWWTTTRWGQSHVLRKYQTNRGSLNVYWRIFILLDRRVALPSVYVQSSFLRR